MENITEQQVLEAKAYNDTIKNYMDLQNKLELLYDDLRAYVANELGEKKMKALEKIVNTFIEGEVEFVLYGLKRMKHHDGISDKFLNEFSVKTLKEVVKIVLNNDDIGVLLHRIRVVLLCDGYYDDDIDEMGVLQDVLNGNSRESYTEEILDTIIAMVSKKYYDYFYVDLEYHLNKIIDNYSQSGKSLESKVAELKSKKEAQL